MIGLLLAFRQLRHERRLLSALLDTVEDGVIFLDRTGRVTGFNRAAEDLFGYQAADILRHEVCVLFPAADRSTIAATLHTPASDLMLRPSIAVGRRKDGATFAVQLRLAQNERGGWRGWAMIVRDITLHQQSAQELLDSEAKTRAILQTVVDGIITIDARGTILSANPAAERVFGFAASEMIGNNVGMLMPEPDRSHHDGYIARYLRSGERRIIGIGREVRGQRKDGSVFPMDLSVGEAMIGTARIFTGVVRDISERKRTEDALFAEKERAQVTLHSIGEGVITIDREGRVDYMNPVAETLTGWSFDEAAGMPFDEVLRIVEEFSHAPITDPVKSCLAENRPIKLPEGCVLISRSGAERAIDDTAAPIRDRDGQVQGAVLVISDVTEKREMSRQLQHDAAHDPLTGLVNRRGFERRLERALARAHEYDLRHAVCFIDLDQFKLVNDTAGHAAGDSLLRQVRGLLSGKFRERDTLARLGGDEFALLLENCGLQEAARIAQVVAGAFHDWRFTWQKQTFRVGVSIGVTAISRATQSIQQVMSEADVACYTAKERGRGRIYVYQQDGADPMSSHGQILVAANLQQAIEQNRFRLFGQPIVPLGTEVGGDGTRHYEVLLRMLDRDDGILLPESFIPAAERYGFMVAIDRWVIARSLEAIAARRGDADNVDISINLSAASLNTGDMAAYVEAQFARSSVSPERVCFEITETSTIHNLEQAKGLIGEIRALGSRFAIDDFGSGRSSFQYLRALPADYLKIDGSFVQNMIESAQDEAVVAAINEVGHTLGINTVAEFAHSAAIVERLREMNVDYAQGYALGVPEPLHDAL